MTVFLRTVVLLGVFFISFLSGWEPQAVYVLLENHPDEQMAIQWVATEERKKSTLIFSEMENSQWYKVEGTRTSLPLPDNLYLHRVVLTGLKPETTYQFKIKKGGATYRFSTLPAGLERPVSFVVGGDIYHDEIDFVRKMNKVVAAKNPDFVLLGGDIAYAHSNITFLPESVLSWSQELLAKMHLKKNKRLRWMEWLRAWSEDMVTPDGRLIPMAATIGNHDVNGGYNQSSETASAFYLLFMGGSPTVYRTIDFGKDLSIVFLDSGHTAHIGGAQTLWLYNALRARRDVPRKFAIYHVPAYPSVRSTNFKQSVMVRRHWVPFFEAFNLDAAFENHDHAYKRTVPIRGDKEDPTGVLYLGDGSWGVESPRKPKPKKDKWFLAFAAQKRSVLLVEVARDKVLYTAYDDDGAVIEGPLSTQSELNPK